MFSRNSPHRQAFNAKNSRYADKASDLSLSRVNFGDDYSPVLWSAKYAHLDMWPITAHMMALLNIHPETYLVRITAPEFVDQERGLISGHSNPVAKVDDPYDLKKHPLLDHLMLPKTKQAKDIGLECLNVVYTNTRISLHRAKRMVSGYRKSEKDIVISFQMKDVLSCGGRIYRDTSSSLENVLIIGLPKGACIPFKVI